ncbi:MAG: carbohydrate ABC transporter permease, partial [Bacteroidota bacterium]
MTKTTGRPDARGRNARRYSHLFRLSPAKRIVLHLVLLTGSILMLIPFYWMLSTSLKDAGEIFVGPFRLPARPQWVNYAHIFQAVPYARFYLNTIVYAGSVTALQLLTCGMAAYGFARLRFPGRDAIFMALLGTMMMPWYVTLIPSYLLISWFGWINTFWALIVPGAGSAFGTFLLRQFFMTIPKELDDAAIMDGCSRFGALWRIYYPLSGPALATLGLFTFMGTWNSFLWPLVVTTSLEMRTVPLAMAMFRDQYITQWNYMMAAAVVAT